MDSIILVHYLRVRDMPIAKIREAIQAYKENVITSLEERGIINMIVPIYNGDSHIKCLNPKLVSAENYKAAYEVVKEANERLDNWMQLQIQRENEVKS